MNDYLGLNTAGIKPINDAISAYKSAVKKINFNVTKGVVKQFAAGSSSVNAINAMLDSADRSIENIFTKKLDPFSSRISQLTNQYKKNDTSQGSDLKSRTSKVLKS